MLFNKDFSQFVYARCSSTDPVIISDPEYKKSGDEFDRLFRRIADLLGPENDKLVYELESNCSERACISINYAYKTGLKDGAALIQELGLIGNRTGTIFL